MPDIVQAGQNYANEAGRLLTGRANIEAQRLTGKTNALLGAIEPITKALTPLNEDQKLAQRMTIEEAKAKRQAVIDEAADNAAIQAAMKTNIGPDGALNPHGVVESLNASGKGKAAMKFGAAYYPQVKAQAEAEALQLKNEREHIDLVRQALNGVTPDNYPVRYKWIAANDPKTAQVLGQTFNQDAIDFVRDGGTQVGDYIKQKKDAIETAIAGLSYSDKLVESAAQWMPSVPDPEWDNERHRYIAMGVNPALIPEKPSAEARAQVQQLGISPEKKAELAGQAEGRQRMAEAQQSGELHQRTQEGQAAASLAETIRHNKADEATARANVARLAAGSAPPKPIDAGTPDFKVAQDLAYGRMTPGFFRTLEAYNRDSGKKAALYAKAAELNPNFNEADFERGFKFISNPQTGRQLSALDNAMSGIPDLLAASEAAKRSGVTVLNKFGNPVKVAIGSKTFSNLNVARKAWADEVSGGLGFGTATDMKLALGLDLTDTNLGPDNFRSAIQDIVLPFLERKKAAILNQASVYGKDENNSSLKPGGAPVDFPISVGAKTYHFKTQADLDNFKRDMGIK